MVEATEKVMFNIASTTEIKVYPHI